MDRWPSFEERFAPELWSEAPVYQDGLISVLLFLLLLGALSFTIGRARRKGRGDLLPLAFSVLQSIFLTAVVLTLISLRDESLFWYQVGYVTVVVSALFAVSLLIYFWIWVTFSRGANKALWFVMYLKCWGYFGFAFYLPIALLFFAPNPEILLFVSFVLFYVSFRVVVFIRTLKIFPYLRRYPLHIILYLCACEIAPVLFALERV